MAKGYPNLYRLGNTTVWSAAVDVPTELQSVILTNGKPTRRFVRSTGETEIHAAYVVAAPWIQEWRERIANARETMRDTGDAEIAKLADKYKAARDTALTDDKAAFLYDVLTFVFEEYGSLSPSARRDSFRSSQAAATALAGLPRAEAILDRVTGFASAPAKATPFLAHLKDWEAIKPLSPENMPQARKQIEAFAAANPGVTIETVTDEMVQRWIEALMNGEKPLAASSVTKYLKNIRTYWARLATLGIVAKSAANPFAGRTIYSDDDCLAGEDEGKEAFTMAQSFALYRSATCPAMADAIKIARLSGIRLSSIASLNVNEVRDAQKHFATIGEVDGVRVFRVGEKGRYRIVPIHSAIVALIDKLVTNADAEGCLFPSFKANKFGRRGPALGRKFSDYKAAQGFSADYSFHSFRHGWNRDLETAGATDKVQKLLMGHAMTDITKGTGKNTYGLRVRDMLPQMVAAIETMVWPD